MIFIPHHLCHRKYIHKGYKISDLFTEYFILKTRRKKIVLNYRPYRKKVEVIEEIREPYGKIVYKKIKVNFIDFPIKHIIRKDNKFFNKNVTIRVEYRYKFSIIECRRYRKKKK